MGIISNSNMGIAFRELFTDAAGVGVDLLTLPVRHAISIYKMEDDEPEPKTPAFFKAMVAGFTPGMSTCLVVAPYSIWGSKALPLAISCATAFQYSMDLMMSQLHEGNRPFHVFPSLQPKPSV